MPRSHTAVRARSQTVSSSRSARPEKDVALDEIAVKPERLRALRPEVIAELAKSMADIGQLQPIVLRHPRGESGYWLVAGRHRLEAARKLKWWSIRASVLDDMTADQAELAEIDENLMRADLSPAERAMHLEQRKRLYEKLHPETKHGGDRRSKQSTRQNGDLNRFTKDTAIKTGKSERTVQREVSRASKIVALAAVPGTSLDKPDELDALAKLPESEQRDLIEKAKSGEQVTAKQKTDCKAPKPPAKKSEPAAVSKPQPAVSPASEQTAQPKTTHDDFGPNSAGEYARLRARIAELENDKRRLEIKVVALESEIAELKEAGAQVLAADA